MYQGFVHVGFGVCGKPFMIQKHVYINREGIYEKTHSNYTDFGIYIHKPGN